MKIEVKNLKIAASLSEETTAYTATIYVDGKPAFRASNHGHGACDDFWPIGPDAPSLTEVNRYIAEHVPPMGPFEEDPAKRELYDNGIDADLETLVQRAMTEQDDAKQWKRITSVVAVLTPKGISTWPKTKLPPTEANLQRIRDAISKGTIKGELINGGSDELIARAKLAFGLKPDEDSREALMERLTSDRLTAADARFLKAEDLRAEKPTPDFIEAMDAIIAEGARRDAEHSAAIEARHAANRAEQAQRASAGA